MKSKPAFKKDKNRKVKSKNKKSRLHCSFTTLGSSVAIIRATDTNNDPMVFSLDSSIQDLLQIDVNSGNLTLKKELDREVSWKMHQFAEHNLETGQSSHH